MNRFGVSAVWKVGLILGVLLVMFTFSQRTSAQSTITGLVYDKLRNPIVDVDVELLNEYYQTIRRAKSDGSGRYQFSGLNNGRFSVRVYAFRFDLEDQTQEIEVNTQNVRGGQGSGYFVLDFYLVPRKGGLAESELGVVFAQNVPPEAKKLYDTAVGDLAAKRTEAGLKGLNDAVQLFPEYFAALHRAGKELFAQARYEDAARFMYKAVEVNPKSASSFYYLGLSFLKMGKDYNKASLASLNQALVLAPSSVQVLWGLGRAERADGKFKEAEAHLLQAKKMNNDVAEIHKELAELYGNDLKKYGLAADELEAYVKLAKLQDADEAAAKKVIANLREKAKNQ